MFGIKFSYFSYLSLALAVGLEDHCLWSWPWFLKVLASNHSLAFCRTLRLSKRIAWQSPFSVVCRICLCLSVCLSLCVRMCVVLEPRVECLFSVYVDTSRDCMASSVTSLDDDVKRREAADTQAQSAACAQARARQSVITDARETLQHATRRESLSLPAELFLASCVILLVQPYFSLVSRVTRCTSCAVLSSVNFCTLSAFATISQRY